MSESTQAQRVTTTVTDTVTETLHPLLSALGWALLYAHHGDSQVTDTVTDTMTDSATDTVTDTATAPCSDTSTHTDATPVTDITSDTSAVSRRPRQVLHHRCVTDTAPQVAPKLRGRKPVGRKSILDLLREHPEGLTSWQIKVFLGTTQPVSNMLARMLKAGLLVRLERGPGVRYRCTRLAARSTPHRAADQEQPCAPLEPLTAPVDLDAVMPRPGASLESLLVRMHVAYVNLVHCLTDMHARVVELHTQHERLLTELHSRRAREEDEPVGEASGRL